jgi:hypothetical protein
MSLQVEGVGYSFWVRGRRRDGEWEDGVGVYLRGRHFGQLIGFRL